MAENKARLATVSAMASLPGPEGDQVLPRVVSQAWVPAGSPAGRRYGSYHS